MIKERLQGKEFFYSDSFFNQNMELSIIFSRQNAKQYFYISYVNDGSNKLYNDTNQRLWP